jgi:hypothetical protein
MESVREPQQAPPPERVAPASTRPDARSGPETVLKLQRQIGNRAVRRLLRDPKTPVQAPAPSVQAEDAKTIVDQHLDTWYQNARWGIEKASLSGDDEAMKWFLVALGGNLLWAATAFLNPAAAVANATYDIPDSMTK